MSQVPEVHHRNAALSHLSRTVFWAIHAACLLAFVLPFSWQLVALALGGYVLRMWGVTAGYHRYFSHRTYKTSRAMQFVLAWIGATATQKGPLWWGSLHRHHHRFSDQPRDVHSPVQRGFWYSHAGWFLGNEHNDTDLAAIKDFAKFPELRFIDKYFWIPPATYAFACWLIAGVPGLVWGYAISTVLLWHGVFTINSLAHVWGARRYETTDTSRNNPLLALITLGEGWHNNHHHYMNSTNQGFFWWEIDVSYYVLRVMSWVGLVWDIRTPPAHIRDPQLANARVHTSRIDTMLGELAALRDQSVAALGARREELQREFARKWAAARAELDARRAALAAEWVARKESALAELARAVAPATGSAA